MSIKVVGLRILIASVALIVTTSPLFATPIAPGQTVVPGPLSPPVTPPTVLNTFSGTFNLDSGALIGTYNEVVYVDPFGITCAGCLDFVFQVSNDASSTDAIRRVGLNPLNNVMADVDFISGTGDVAPDQALRAPGLGPTVSFFFISNPVAPGHVSDIMVIATNATAYRVAGSLGFDVISNTGAIFPVPTITTALTPVAPVPEPATLVLVGSGLVAVARRRLRERRG